MIEEFGKYLTREDIAKRYGVAPATINSWREAGNFPDPDVRVSRLIRWTPQAVQDWEIANVPFLTKRDVDIYGLPTMNFPHLPALTEAEAEEQSRDEKREAVATVVLRGQTLLLWDLQDLFKVMLQAALDRRIPSQVHENKMKKTAERFADYVASLNSYRNMIDSAANKVGE